MLLAIGRHLGERIERERAYEHGQASEQLLAEAERAAGAGSFEADLRTGVAECSAGLMRMMMAPNDSSVTLEAMLARVHPDDRELVTRSVMRRPGTEEPLSVEVRALRFDGVTRIVRARGIATFDDQGTAIRLVGTVQDVTDEAMARAGRDLLSYVVDSSDDAILTNDDGGTITSWNRGAERLYGYSVDEAIGESVALIEPPNREGQQLEIIHRAFGGESIDRVETTHIRKDGTPVTVSMTVSPVREASSRIVSAAIIARDITELKRDQERLRHLSDRDQLTGLYNRRRFDQELKRELARAGRSQSRSALLSVDIDNFKAINDSAGHAAGDAVLSELAGIVTSRFGSGDVVARLGGDEFGILMSAVEPGEARAAANDLLSAIRSSPVMYGESRARYCRCSDRGTIASIWPNRRFCSERPKSSESFSLTISWTTRGPVNARRAPGSAMMTSPSVAKLAIAPPVVGFVEQAEERQPRLVELVDRRDGLRQLHQREDPLLHPRSARARDQQERRPLQDRLVARAHELLPDGAPHRSTHEREVHHRQLERMAVERRSAHHHRVGQTGVQLRLRESLPVGAQVEERERVGRSHLRRLLDERAGVGEPRDSSACRHAEVVSALRAHPGSRLQLVVAVVRPAAGTRIRVFLLGRRALHLLDLHVDTGFAHRRHDLRPERLAEVAAAAPTSSGSGRRAPGRARRDPRSRSSER